jgi:hypothetical protein
VRTVGGHCLGGGNCDSAVFRAGSSQIRQTVSEIGEMGSSAEVPFSGMLLIGAVLIAFFSVAVYRASAARGYGPIGVCFVGLLAVLLAGLAMCPFPHPLPNVLGTSELLVYQAPVVFALQWRKVSQGSKAGGVLVRLLRRAVGQSCGEFRDFLSR